MIDLLVSCFAELFSTSQRPKKRKENFSNKSSSEPPTKKKFQDTNKSVPKDKHFTSKSPMNKTKSKNTSFKGKTGGKKDTRPNKRTFTGGAKATAGKGAQNGRFKGRGKTR